MLIDVDPAEAKAIQATFGKDLPELAGKATKALRSFRNSDIRSKRGTAYVAALEFVEGHSAADFGAEFVRILGLVERGERLPK